MSVTERTEIEEIEFVGPGPYKRIQVRYVKIEEENGVEINRTVYHRIFEPGVLDENNNLIDTDLSNEDNELKQLASSSWTDEVKKEWRQKLIADLNT
jgi:hypothetical protein